MSKAKMKTECPHCKSKFKTRDKYKGEMVNCPKCSRPFFITPFIGAAQAEICKSHTTETEHPEAVGKRVEEHAAEQLVQRAFNRITCKKHHIISIDSSIIKGTARFSPDGGRAAHIRFVPSGGWSDKACVVVDGVSARAFDKVRPPIFSPDSTRVAYIAKEEDKWFVVVDGHFGKEYDGIIDGSLVFSPDGKRVAYVAIEGGIYTDKYFVVVDGQEGKRYDEIRDWRVVFSADSNRVAYGACQNQKWLVVADDQMEEEYDSVGVPIFSPDSKRVAYVAHVDRKHFVVVDGQKEREYAGMGKAAPLFSPDSKRIAYVARTGRRYFVVADGQEGKQYKSIGGASVTFSPDSKRLAYTAMSKPKCFSIYKWFVIVDDREGKPYWDIGKGYGGFLELPGQGKPIFSPDSKHVAYIACLEQTGFKKKLCVVVDGQEGEPYDDIAAASLTFSPDGKRIAYVAGLKITWRKLSAPQCFAVVDGQESKRWYGISQAGVTFSPDSKMVAYVAKDLGKEFLIIDGKEVRQYDTIVSNIIFDTPDRFHYIAANGKDICFVEERIE